MLGYKIFGYNTFGLRFFSALSMVTIVVLVALYLKQKQGSIASIVSIILFISCSKLLWSHCARTADPDAVFLLFFTIAILSLLKYKDNVVYLYICGIAFSLAFLTKSWHSFTIIPIVFFYLLFTKGFKEIKWWQFIIFFSCSLFFVLIWFIVRCSIDGMTFFKGMLETDLINRSQGKIEGNVQPFYYYFKYYFLSINTFSVCFYLNLIVLIIQIVKKEKFSELVKLTIISLLSILIIFSISKVKIYWYVYPIIVPLILLTSENFERYLLCCFNKKVFNILKLAGFTLCVCITAYCTMFSFWYVLKSVPQTKQVPIFVKELEIEKGEVLYYQDENTSNFSQSQVLYFELYYNAYTRAGGLDKYLTDREGYIILDEQTFNANSTYLTKEKQSNDGYCLCKYI